MAVITKEELYKELAEIRNNLSNRDLTFEERWREEDICKMIAILEDKDCG